MKKKRYSYAQITSILRQAESGVPESKPCQEHGMSNAVFTNSGRSLVGWMHR